MFWRNKTCRKDLEAGGRMQFGGMS